MAGLVTHLFTAPYAGAPMQAHQQATALQGLGLDGDRYAAGAGYYSAQAGNGRHLTLIAQEDLDAANTELESAHRVQPHETRRNVVTTGIDLMAMIGHEFTIGGIRCVATRPCHPCRYLDSLLGREAYPALLQRAGIRAEILTTGTIHVGDAIAAVNENSNKQRQSFDSARSDTVGL
jgi:MOSC domain-containing protein YiiM